MKEQKIAIGLITSDEYIRQVAYTFDTSLMDSAPAKLLARWCLDYFAEFEKAPGDIIEDIFMQKLEEGKIKDELAEEIQEDILPMLSKQYAKKGVNVPHLLKVTETYFKTQRLKLLVETIEDKLEKGEVEEAENKVRAHKEIEVVKEELDFSSKELPDKIRSAFASTNIPVFWYPGVLGDFMNSQLIRGGLIGIMAPEKRGKTFFLLDMAIRAARQGVKVAFFQAGDMTEAQQLRRVGIYLAKKSDQERYCGKLYIPTKDCIHNQLDTCDKKCREDNPALFEENERTELLEKTGEELIELYEQNPQHSPCHNCLEYRRKSYGVPWLKKREIKFPLEAEESVHLITKYFSENNKRMKLSTHALGTLSIKKMNAILNTWEYRDGFLPELILVDYADLLVPDTKEFRHGQNEIWKGLRGMSQSREALVVAPTQTDAGSYEKDTLTLQNFSEDKRKFSHVTAMYGLNQSKDGREKGIGLLRLNEILIREGKLEITRQVTVLQQLAIGRPVLGSYWATRK